VIHISLKHLSDPIIDVALHGYEIGQQIAARATGTVSFQPASLYPVLYRLERRGLIAGRWVEKARPRRRRYYCLTAGGRRVLAERRKSWSTFMQAVQAAAGLKLCVTLAAPEPSGSASRQWRSAACC
jgi:DNA-binding PadR family transcriptional regulator